MPTRKLCTTSVTNYTIFFEPKGDIYRVLLGRHLGLSLTVLGAAGLGFGLPAAVGIQLAELLLEVVGVVVDVGSGWNPLHQLGEVDDPSGALQLLAQPMLEGREARALEQEVQPFMPGVDQRGRARAPRVRLDRGPFRAASTR